MSVEDVSTRIDVINHNFLNGMINATLLASISLTNLDTTPTALSNAYNTQSTDLSSTKYPAFSATSYASPPTTYSVVPDLSPRITHIVTTPEGSNFNTILLKYSDILSKINTSSPTTNDPLYVTPPVQHGAVSGLTIDASGNSVYTTTAQAPDPTSRLAQVVNTYTYKRMSVYAILAMNATILAYDKIVLMTHNAGLAAGTSPVTNDVLTNLFAYTMKQFQDFNSLYVPVAQVSAWETPRPALPDPTQPAGSYGLVVGPSATLVATSGSETPDHRSLDAVAGNGTGWLTDAAATASTAFWSIQFPAPITSPTLSVAISGYAAASNFNTVDSLTIMTSQDGSTWTTASTKTGLALTGTSQTYSFPNPGASAFLRVSGSASGKYASVGFAGIGFPAPVLLSTASVPPMPAGGSTKFVSVWASQQDRLFPAAGAVGPYATGWRTAATDASEAALAVVTFNSSFNVNTAGVYWAAAPTPPSDTGSGLHLASYTLAPMASGSTIASWKVYYSTTAVTSTTPINTIAWTQYATGGTESATWTTGASQTFNVDSTKKVTAILIAPQSGSLARAGFASISFSFQTIKDTQKDLVVTGATNQFDLMGTMKSNEHDYQQGVRTLERETQQFKRQQGHLKRVSKQAGGSADTAKRASVVLWAYLAIAVVVVGATLYILLSAAPGQATPVLAGLALAALAAAAVRQVVIPTVAPVDRPLRQTPSTGPLTKVSTFTTASTNTAGGWFSYTGANASSYTALPTTPASGTFTLTLVGDTSAANFIQGSWASDGTKFTTLSNLAKHGTLPMNISSISVSTSAGSSPPPGAFIFNNSESTEHSYYVVFSW